MKTFRFISSTLILLSRSKTEYGQFITKKCIETSFRVKKTKRLCKGHDITERAIERIRSIFRVCEEDSTSSKRDFGVKKRLDTIIYRIGVEGVVAIVSRSLIMILRYCSVPYRKEYRHINYED